MTAASARSLLVVNRHAERCGGAEEVAHRVNGFLAAAGWRITLASATPAARRPIAADERLVLPALLADRDRWGWGARRAARRERRALVGRRFAAALVHNLDNAAGLAAVLDLAPTLRWVHDSQLTCASHVRRLRDGRICEARLGPECLALARTVGCRRLAPGQRLRNRRRVARRLARLGLARRCALHVCASDWLRRELLAHGFDPARVRVLHAPPPPGPARPAPAAGAPFLAGGRFVDAKGLDVLLHALSRARAAPDARVVLAGDGPERPALERLAAALGLRARVEFSGWLGQEALQERILAARFIVVPSVFAEPYATLGTEAQALGRPVIASAVGGLGEWLEDGRTGLFVPPGDAAALARALERLWLDPDLCARMGAAARARWAARPAAAEAYGALLGWLTAAADGVT